MLPHSDHVLSTMGVLVSSLAGFTGGRFVGAIEGVPQWAEYLLGPLGLLVGAVVAIVWFVRRLNSLEENRNSMLDRFESRAKERDESFLSVLEKYSTVVTQNSEVLRRTADALEGNAEVIGYCKDRNQRTGGH